MIYFWYIQWYWSSLKKKDIFDNFDSRYGLDCESNTGKESIKISETWWNIWVCIEVGIFLWQQI